MLATLFASFMIVWSRSMRLLARMADPTIRFVLTDEHLRIESDLGATEIPWRRFVRMRKSRKVWLLYMSSSRYLAVPIEGVSREIRALFDERISR